MMVLDTSAVVSVMTGSVKGPTADEALSLLDQERFIAPKFFCLEASNSAWKHVHAGRLDENKAGELLATTISYVDEFCNDDDLVREAFSEAVRLDHPIYDMLYFVLARRRGVGLFTGDRKLAKICDDNGVESVLLFDL